MARTLQKKVIYTKDAWATGSAAGSNQLIELGFNKAAQNLLAFENDRYLVTQNVIDTLATYGVSYSQVGLLSESTGNISGDAWAKILDGSAANRTWNLYSYNASQAIGNPGKFTTLSGSTQTATRNVVFLKFSRADNNTPIKVCLWFTPTPQGGSTVWRRYLTEETLTIYQIASMPNSVATALAMVGTGIGTIARLDVPPAGLGYQYVEMNFTDTAASVYLMLKSTNFTSKPSYYSSSSTQLVYPAYLWIAAGSTALPKFRWEYDVTAWRAL